MARNLVITSPNGTGWVLRTTPWDASGAASLVDVAWNGSIFVALIRGTPNGIVTSPDGVNWAFRSSPIASGDLTYHVIWSPDFSQFVVTGGLASGDCVLTSPDGLTWTSHAISTYTDTQEVASGAGVVVIGVRTGSWTYPLARTTDLVTWTPVTGSSVLTQPAQGLAFDGFDFLANDGTFGDFASSPDGSTWTHHTNGSFMTPGELGASPGTFVVGRGQGVGFATALLSLTTTNGVSWTPGTTPGSWGNFATIARVSFSPDLGQWVAVGQDGSGSVGNKVLLTSPDGVNWTTHTTPLDDPVTFTASASGAAWASSLGLWCVVGDNPAPTNRPLPLRQRQRNDGLTVGASRVRAGQNVPTGPATVRVSGPNGYR